ncbi:MAG: hypothetical protein PHV51_04750 [Methanosarcinaceae archaeon]|nr:hypothetical protein [Methanosarcinaceae archaeon]MDD4497447.1 hypothetical protein [Methanosarcinaceae archaeon]
MIFLDIVSWEPKDTEAVGKCYEDYEFPEGVKVIDEWIDLMGCRTFVIYEPEDEEAYIASNLPFMGLCRFETIPVMRADRYMEVFQKIAEKAGAKSESL